MSSRKVFFFVKSTLKQNINNLKTGRCKALVAKKHQHNLTMKSQLVPRKWFRRSVGTPYYLNTKCNWIVSHGWIERIYRIMPELRGLLKNNGKPQDQARSARSLFLRKSRSEGITRFNVPFHCFRTSRSLLWPPKWRSGKNNNLPFHDSDLPFHLLKIITCSKQWKGALRLNN